LAKKKKQKNIKPRRKLKRNRGAAFGD